MSAFEDAVIALIRDITVRFLEQWGRVPSVDEIKAAMGGKGSS